MITSTPSAKKRLPRLAIAVPLVLFVSGCFPGPKDLGDDVTSNDVNTTDSASADGMLDAATDSGPDATSGCRIHDDCAELDGPCSDGICDRAGTCRQIPRTGTCDDDDPCTKNDVCDGLLCGGTAYACDDGFTCTNDICDGDGGCLTQIQPNTCFIAGACIAAGTLNPSNACERCTSGSSWTALSATPCDDGDTCTAGDMCDAGNCVPGGLPDDAPDDWLVEVGTSTSAEHGAGIRQVEIVGAQVVVLGDFAGKVDVAPGVSLIDADGAWFVASYSLTGELQWVDVVETNLATLAGVTLDGRLVVTGPGEPGATWTDVTGDSNLGLTAGLDHFIAFVDAEGALDSHFASNVHVRAVSPLDDLYGTLDFNSATAPEGTTAAAPLVYHGTGEREVAVVLLSLDGVPFYRTSIWGSEVAFDSFEIDSDGRMSAIVDAPGDIQYYKTGPSNPLLAAAQGQGAAFVFTDGTVSRAETLAEYDPAFDRYNASGYASNELRMVTASDGGFWFWGSLTVTGADFRGNVRFDAYHYNDFTGRGGIQGAGADAFIARVEDDLDIAWVRFVRPTGVDGMGFPTARFESLFEHDGSPVLALHTLGPSSIEDGAGVLHPLAGNTFLVSYAGDGTPLWSVGNGSDLYDVIVRPFTGGLIIGGLAFDSGTFGFGPTRRPIEVGGSGVGLLQRVNSAGGLVCGATLPPPEE